MLANGRNCGSGMMRWFDEMIGHSDLAVRTVQGMHWIERKQAMARAWWKHGDTC